MGVRALSPNPKAGVDHPLPQGLDIEIQVQVRTRLSAGGRWFRTSGSPFGNDDFRFRKGETGDGEHKRRLEPAVPTHPPLRLSRQPKSGAPRQSLPPKVGHFSLSEAGRRLVQHRPPHLDAGLSMRKPSR
jgi:hypothetical protein